MRWVRKKRKDNATRGNDDHNLPGPGGRSEMECVCVDDDLQKNRLGPRKGDKFNHMQRQKRLKVNLETPTYLQGRLNTRGAPC